MSTDAPIYLDYNATTPVDERVLEAMLPFLRTYHGNPSSAHAPGRTTLHAVHQARAQVAALIGAQPDEIVFTGGGSEADNLAIKGIAFSRLAARPHIVSVSAEHPAVLNTLAYLRARFGVQYDLAPVDRTGRVRPTDIAALIRPDTVLVTVMHANNEVGTVQPIPDIAAICRDHGMLLHVDAAQSVGKLPVDVNDLGADLLTIAGHKLYAPKGIGALYVRRGVILDPLVSGSGQEGGRRAGTENVAGMVALGVASSLAAHDLPTAQEHLRDLRDLLYAQLTSRVPLTLNGHPDLRLPNTLNVSFPGVWGQTILDSAPDVAASTGSACHSGLAEPSPVLSAMGIPTPVALGAVRLSLGRFTTRNEVLRAADLLANAWQTVSSIPA